MLNGYIKISTLENEEIHLNVNQIVYIRDLSNTFLARAINSADVNAKKVVITAIGTNSQIDEYSEIHISLSIEEIYDLIKNSFL